MVTQEKLKELKVADLFSLMAGNDEDERISHLAFDEFHERFKQRFWNICKESSKEKSMIYHGIDVDLFKASIREIFIKAGSYRATNKRTPKKYEEELILGWLSDVAQSTLDNLVKEKEGFLQMHVLVPDYQGHLEAMKEYQHTEEEKDEIAALEGRKPESFLRYRKILNDALATLKPRDRGILLEYFKWNGIRKYLSGKRIDYLCKRWKITPVNMLKIKERALKEVARICLEHEKNQEKGARNINTGRAQVRKEA